VVQGRGRRPIIRSDAIQQQVDRRPRRCSWRNLAGGHQLDNQRELARAQSLIGDNHRVRYDWVSLHHRTMAPRDGFCRGVSRRHRGDRARRFGCWDVTHEVEPHQVRRGGTVVGPTLWATCRPRSTSRWSIPAWGKRSGGPWCLVGREEPAGRGRTTGLLVAGRGRVGRGVVAAYELAETALPGCPEVVDGPFTAANIFAPAAAQSGQRRGQPAEFGPAVQPDRAGSVAASCGVSVIQRAVEQRDRGGWIGSGTSSWPREWKDLLRLGARAPVDAVTGAAASGPVCGRDTSVGTFLGNVPSPVSLLVHVDSAGQVGGSRSTVGRPRRPLGGQVGEVRDQPHRPYREPRRRPRCGPGVRTAGLHAEA